MNLLILHQWEIVRAGLRSVFSSVLEADDLEKALSWAERYRPAAIVVEPVQFPETLAVLAEIAPVVVLTADHRDDSVLRALLSGAAAYVHISEPLAVIRATIEEAAHGSAKLDVVKTRAALRTLLEARQAAFDVREQLSGQEFEVLRLLAQGLTNRQIAEQMTLAEGTVKAYCSRIFHKLGVSNRAQAALWAVKAGLAEEITR